MASGSKAAATPATATEKPARIVTSTQARLAMGLAILVDLMQAPATVAQLSIALAAPVEVVDMAIDAIVAIVMTRLLGFHWALAPGFLAEIVPVVDIAPSWTLAVFAVTRARKREGRFVKTA
jgi:hypothetical protein